MKMGPLTTLQVSRDLQKLLWHMLELVGWKAKQQPYQYENMELCVCSGGCHVVAPSDMMDNRVAAIKTALLQAGLGGKVYIYKEHIICISQCIYFLLYCRWQWWAIVPSLLQLSMDLSGIYHQLLVVCESFSMVDILFCIAQGCSSVCTSLWWSSLLPATSWLQRPRHQSSGKYNHVIEFRPCGTLVETCSPSHTGSRCGGRSWRTDGKARHALSGHSQRR